MSAAFAAELSRLGQVVEALRMRLLIAEHDVRGLTSTAYVEDMHRLEMAITALTRRVADLEAKEIANDGELAKLLAPSKRGPGRPRKVPA